MVLVVFTCTVHVPTWPSAMLAGVSSPLIESGCAVVLLTTAKVSVLLVPLLFCTVIAYVPGVMRRIYIGHIEPAGQFGESDAGIVKLIVWLIPPWQAGFVVQAIAIDEVMGTLRAATEPSINTVLLLVKPKPVIETVVPTAPAVGFIEYKFAATEVGGVTGVTEVPQEILAIAARVSGPT